MIIYVYREKVKVNKVQVFLKQLFPINTKNKKKEIERTAATDVATCNIQHFVKTTFFTCTMKITDGHQKDILAQSAICLFISFLPSFRQVIDKKG